MLEVHHVTKRFGAVTALDDVSFDIGGGEVVALLGRNGAGKTTLTDLVLGLTEPTAGTVTVADTSPREAVRSARIGAVLQTGGLLPDLTVKDTVALLAATHRDPLPVGEVLARADLTWLAGRKVGACSGGEQQRVRLAAALLGRPDFLILDEPTTGMDPASRREFWESMRKQARDGRTIMFSTHYLEEAEDFADRFLVLKQGSLIVDEPADAFLERADKLSTSRSRSALEETFQELTK